MVLRHVLSCLIAAFTLVLCAGACRAGFTFLGPTPYLSAADSPFADYLSGPNFYLEDFEDGELNTPGIFQPLHHVFGTAFHGQVMGPSELTDSVDADDGAIDGSGIAGHSFRSGALFVSPTVPQRNQVNIDFGFDPAGLGYLPDAFGFVWTDGPVGIDYFRPGLDLRFIVTDADGNEFVSPYFKLFANVDRNGRTAEDFFFGVLADAGIATVTIFGVYYGDSETMPYFEIDHVQYGRTVIPEPDALSLVMFFVGLLSARVPRIVC